jgi:hypothetical protein
MNFFKDGWFSRPIVSGRELLSYSAISLMASTTWIQWSQVPRYEWMNDPFVLLLAFAAIVLAPTLFAIGVAEYRNWRRV